jgi:hypothetical protein
VCASRGDALVVVPLAEPGRCPTDRLDRAEDLPGDEPSGNGRHADANEDGDRERRPQRVGERPVRARRGRTAHHPLHVVVEHPRCEERERDAERRRADEYDDGVRDEEADIESTQRVHRGTPRNL